MIAWLLLNAAFALPALNSPHRAGAGAPNDAAVVVGVEDYAFIADVPYAGADARLVYDTLLYTVGIPQHKIQLLQGGSREQILQRVEDAAAMVGPGGRLWFYFAGHGAASLHSGERMLLGDDVKADSSVFDARGVRLSELTALAHDKESLWLLDTCFAGQGRGGEALLPGTRFAVPTQATRIPAQTAIWAASSPSELAAPLHEMGHGLFTYLAVGSLRGWADGELTGSPDGAVDLEEAQAYVRRATASLSVVTQHPQLDGALGALTRGHEQGPAQWGLAALPQNPPPNASLPLPPPPKVVKRAKPSWWLPLTGAAVGTASYLVATGIERPTEGQVGAFTAINAVGWGAAGLGLAWNGVQMVRAKHRGKP